MIRRGTLTAVLFVKPAPPKNKKKKTFAETGCYKRATPTGFQVHAMISQHHITELQIVVDNKCPREKPRPSSRTEPLNWRTNMVERKPTPTLSPRRGRIAARLFAKVRFMERKVPALPCIEAHSFL